MEGCGDNIRRKSGRSIRGISDLGEQISMYARSSPLLPQKLAYVAVNLVCLYLAIWKCGKLGLVPTKPSDWLPLLLTKEVGTMCVLRLERHVLTSAITDGMSGLLRTVQRTRNMCMQWV